MSSTNECGCTPCSDTTCDPNNEPLSSALTNFISTFYGSLVKTCVNNQIVWVLPCNLDTGFPGYPRVVGEGLACYFLRVFGLISASTFIKVTSADAFPNNLQAKTFAGNEISLTVLNPGGNEQLKVAYSLPVSSSVSASNIDWSLSYSFFKTLGANTVFTFSNTQEGKTIVMSVTNTAGNFTATWPAAVQWANSLEPVLTVGVKTDVFTFIMINGVIYGSVVQNMS